MDRILTTHTGSLARPRAVLDFLAAEARGETIDAAAYERALDDAVADIVKRQVEAGLDVVDDGEMGKATWITYLYERVRGLEPRMVPLEGGNILPPSRDRQAFPEFYAEHDAAFAREVENQVRIAGDSGSSPSAAEIEAEGKRWVCTGPLEYDSGVICHVELSWLAPSKLRRTSIVGSRKMLLYDDTSNEPVRVFDSGVNLKDPATFGEYRMTYRSGDIVSPHVPATEPLLLEMTDFCEAVRFGRQPRSSAALGIEVVRMIEAVDRSLASDGARIDVAAATGPGEHRPARAA